MKSLNFDGENIHHMRKGRQKSNIAYKEKVLLPAKYKISVDILMGIIKVILKCIYT